MRLFFLLFIFPVCIVSCNSKNTSSSTSGDKQQDKITTQSTSSQGVDWLPDVHNIPGTDGYTVFFITGLGVKPYAVGLTEEYYGVLAIADTSEVFSPGWIGIYRKSDRKEMIKVESEELAFTLHDGEVKANIQELPYGEQSVIIYDDFNFDGKNDFAIMEGQNSCYHGPSFNIYLADQDWFTYSEEFSRLAQEYCGMFDYNKEEKTINTMTKSGCCWHQYSVFKVENNTPIEMSVLEVDNMMPNYSVETLKERKRGKMVETVTKYLTADVDTILFFTLENKKKVLVFPLYDRQLDYVLTKEDGAIEFDYLQDVAVEDQDFSLQTTANGKTLTFPNKNTIYKIYENSKDIGIEVVIGNKTHHLKGNIASKSGSLAKIKLDDFDNVH